MIITMLLILSSQTIRMAWVVLRTCTICTSIKFSRSRKQDTHTLLFNCILLIEFLVLPSAWVCVFYLVTWLPPCLCVLHRIKSYLSKKKRKDNVWLQVVTTRDSPIWIWCCPARFFLWLCLAFPQTQSFFLFRSLGVHVRCSSFWQ